MLFWGALPPLLPSIFGLFSQPVYHWLAFNGRCSANYQPQRGPTKVLFWGARPPAPYKGPPTGLSLKLIFS